MAMVRLEPAGRAIVPDATPPATGILKIKAVGMSAAVTSATKVATAAADKSALSRSRASGGRRPPSVGSLKRSEEHTSELQSLAYLVCRLLLEKKKQQRPL